PGSICCSLVNAGKSRIYGFEFDGTARIASNVDLTVQGSVIRSKYLEFMSGPIDYSGTQLANVPRYQLRLAPEARLPLAAG
ncbi:TonB-dependent receptor domain-containing protein, partial [Rhizorhabdus wittichii]|uniref:TonB-dependent receptor domain-containing protein n=1 Tax=Rhizorhabdus wittichii TaxID=160791 RepID=UPI0005652015